MQESDNPDTPSAPRPGSFPQTRWTIVLEAAGLDATKAEQAVQELCAIYRDPIWAWLKRSLPNPSEAEDLAQGFVEFLLQRNRFSEFEHRDVKFRSFLLLCLKRYLRGEWEKTQAEKRGAGAEPVNIDDVEVGSCADIDRLLDVQFALAIHRRTLRQLETGKYAPEAKRARFQELRRFILGQDSSVSYEEIGTRLGLKVNAIKKAVFDLRDAYCAQFEAEVREIAAPGAVEDEMKYLLSLLAAPDGAALV